MRWHAGRVVSLCQIDSVVLPTSFGHVSPPYYHAAQRSSALLTQAQKRASTARHLGAASAWTSWQLARWMRQLGSGMQMATSSTAPQPWPKPVIVRHWSAHGPGHGLCGSPGMALSLVAVWCLASGQTHPSGAHRCRAGAADPCRPAHCPRLVSLHVQRQQASDQH